MADRPGSRDWLLAVACAVIPAVAVHGAWLLSLHAGIVPECIPHLEGCTSISRAARHGHGNVLFKALMLPCSLLQALHWRAAGRWMAARDAGSPALILAMGIVAALALAAYTAALGTDGAFYQWMRRFGITFYFGATFFAILAFERRLLATGQHRGIARAMLGLCGLMLLLGVASTIATAATVDPLKDRIENVLEWQLGVLLTLWFVLHAMLVRPSGAAG